MNSFFLSMIAPIIASIEHYPDRAAMFIDHKYYSYQQLGDCISKIRHHIRCNNLGHKVIGLVDNADFETYASILAIWLEGGYYVPLQPDWPHQRCLDVISKGEIQIIFDTSNKSVYNTACVENPHCFAPHNDYLQIENDQSDEDLACILFTSGSTGTPKGVKISRRNLGAAICSFWKTGIDITVDDRCLQCHDLSFVVSIQCIFAPLQKGACVYAIPSGEIKYAYIIMLLDKYQLTYCQMVVSMLVYILPYIKKIHHDQIKTFVIHSEPCRIELVEKMKEELPLTDIIVYYGATETTLHTTYYRPITDQYLAHNGYLTIGKAIPAVHAIIIDESGVVVPTGQKGELCIGGDMVSSGYWHDDDSSKKSFFYKTINGNCVRFYHTGDWSYQDNNEYLYLCGRMNNMIKIQGNRVEVSEIEDFAMQYLQNKNVTCISHEREDYLTEIVMFIRSEPFPVNELIHYLSQHLPVYMVPHTYKFIKEFPLNSNGKIDRIALKHLI